MAINNNSDQNWQPQPCPDCGEVQQAKVNYCPFCGHPHVIPVTAPINTDTPPKPATTTPDNTKSKLEEIEKINKTQHNPLTEQPIPPPPSPKPVTPIPPTAPPSRPKQTAIKIPDGVKGWSWGAFLLNFIWAIGNRTWIGLLIFVPVLTPSVPHIVSLIMAIILGRKGREWAWKSKSWQSVEQFNAVQREWSKWGVILFFIFCFVAAGLSIFRQHIKEPTNIMQPGKVALKNPEDSCLDERVKAYKITTHRNTINSDVLAELKSQCQCNSLTGEARKALTNNKLTQATSSLAYAQAICQGEQHDVLTPLAKQLTTAKAQSKECSTLETNVLATLDSGYPAQAKEQLLEKANSCAKTASYKKLMRRTKQQVQQAANLIRTGSRQLQNGNPDAAQHSLEQALRLDAKVNGANRLQADLANTSQILAATTNNQSSSQSIPPTTTPTIHPQEPKNRLPETPVTTTQTNNSTYKLAKTAEIEKAMATAANDNDCGEFKFVACLANVKRQGYQDAYNFSRSCEYSTMPDATCALSASQIIESAILKQEKYSLEQGRKHYTYIISHPSQDDYNDLVEKCQKEAINKGIISNGNDEYIKNVCEPGARTEFIVSQSVILKRIDLRLGKINSQLSILKKAAAAASATSTSAAAQQQEPQNVPNW